MKTSWTLKSCVKLFTEAQTEMTDTNILWRQLLNRHAGEDQVHE